jgi:hypothetical protein
MTPPTAEAAAGRLSRRPAPRTPRRVSGPGRAPAGRTARPRLHTRPAARTSARRRVATGLLAWLRELPDSRLLDRLVRGRGWIALVGVGLIGIVFLQVSLLNLNAGISRSVTAAETLERQNSALRQDISELDTGDRLAEGAAKLGLIMPSAGEVTFLDARQANARRAVAGIRPPQAPAAPTAEELAAAATTAAPATGASTPATATTGTAPAGTATGTTAAASPAGTAAAATATAGSATIAAGTTAAGTTAAGTTSAAPVSSGATTGGAVAGTATTAASTTPTTSQAGGG